MIWPSGNRCGHKRDAPRLKLAFQPRRRRPPFVRKLMSFAEKLWFRRGALLARLGVCARSERAEAIVLVVKALLLQWDIITSRVGMARGDGYLVGISVQVIAKWANINVGRAQLAICALMRAGFLQGSQHVEEVEPGRWVAMPKVRRIHWSLFFVLGIDRNELEQAVESAKQQRAAKSTPAPASSPPAHREGEPTGAGELLAHLAAHNAAREARMLRGPPDDD